MVTKVAVYKAVSVDRSYGRWVRCIVILLGLVAIETGFMLGASVYLYRTNQNQPRSAAEDVVTTAAPHSPFSLSADDFLQEYVRQCDGIENDTLSLGWSGNWSNFTPRSLGNSSEPLCPCLSPNLEGRRNVTVDSAPEFGEMELMHPELLPGGAWHPLNCRARHQVAVIVPFRDRAQHLRVFLSNMHAVLQNQQLNYRIFVVEQSSPRVFNKAAMMNIGFREAQRIADFDCFVFHDVDMIPEDDRNLYACSSQPRHVGSHIDKFKYEVPYPGIFGGATAFTAEQFTLANGYATKFYGWGGEDDDMYNRVVSSGQHIVRYPESVARFRMIKHKADKGNPYNRFSYLGWRRIPRVYRRDGLSSLQYKKRFLEFRPLYTWIYAEIPDPRQNPINIMDWHVNSCSRLHSPRTLSAHVVVLVLLILFMQIS